MKKISTSQIAQEIEKLLNEANFILPNDIYENLISMREQEITALAKETFNVLIENADIAKNEKIPLCQDCGVTIILIELGQEIYLEGKDLYTEINSSIEKAYQHNYLRKSVVADPLRRKNTGTNTPAFIHTDIVPGDKLNITVYIKGGGSENMTSLKMFRPTDTTHEIIKYIKETIIDAGPNPCPPIYLGIGIGGTADIAMLNSKKAVLRKVGKRHQDPYYSDLELTIKEILNNTNIGPLGFGGKSTVAEVYIKEAPTHIATLPVALNLNCHSFRYRTITL